MDRHGAIWLKLGGVLLALVLAGCATPPQTQRLLSAPAAFQTPVELKEVPFFPQDDYQCGPAALAMALNWTGVQVLPDDLTPRVYLPERKGSLQAEMVAATRRYGRVGYVLRPKLEDLLQEVKEGNPVVVLENLSFNWYPTWHYAVVIGYDLERREVILRSGRDRRLALPLRTFEYMWRRGNHWALVVVPPDRIPGTAEENAYLQAVVGLERVQRLDEASTAYRTALERWPDSLGARIGLGNSRYGLGDMNGAEQAFREAVAHYPETAVGFNNLAQVLVDQGRLAEAAEAARRAVAIGGPLKERYVQTLEEIMERQAACRDSDAAPCRQD